VPIKKKSKLACTALMIGVSWAAMPARAQSLALSYDMDVRRETVERVTLPNYQCSGSDWLSLIASCTRDREALSSPEESATAQASGIRRVTVGAAGHAAPAAIPHQALQTADDASDLRRRAADVSLRIGSKNRPIPTDESRDLPRFVDTPYENYLQSNAHKAIGLELLVPFQ
jgi:hypothetical protein